MENKKNLLETIPISKIEIGKTNPRKRFDEQELQELSESVKQYGVLQPILIRPKTKTKYELVCGERRFRASKMAGLETIPCNIRELSDDEAFELQIIENLERKDVHPLDEADAFKKMLDSGKYTIEDIAAKLAKTETFVAQRMKLTDLIDEIRTDFFSGNLGIGHAVLIARCDEETQKSVYENAHYYNNSTDYGTISELKEFLSKKEIELDNALFDKSEENLVSGCVSCELCPKRSGANPLLFSDMEGKDICFDEKCFTDKTDAFIEKEVLRIINENEAVVFLRSSSSYIKKPSNSVLKILSENEKIAFSQYEDFVTYEPNSHINYKLKRGFWIGSNEAGKYKDVFVYEKEINKNNLSDSSENLSEEEKIKSEIEKLESQVEVYLSKESDRCWEKFVDIDISDTLDSTSGFSPKEMKTIFIALLDRFYYDESDKVFEKCFKTEVPELSRIELIKNNEVTTEMLNLALRNLIDSPRRFGNENSSLNSYGHYNWLQVHRSEEIKKIQSEQKAETEKFIEKIKSKISDLQGKLESLNQSDEFKKSKKKVKSKAGLQEQETSEE